MAVGPVECVGWLALACSRVILLAPDTNFAPPPPTHTHTHIHLPGDVRESAAAYVVKALLGERAELRCYDPKVTRDAFLWELEYTNGVTSANTPHLDKLFHVDADPYTAAEGADAVCILTEWDAFKTLNWSRVFDAMRKPAFVFDGRNILDHAALRALGFEVYAVGKPTVAKDGASSFASPRGGF